MAERRDQQGDERNEPMKGGRDRSLQTEARPGADRDRNTPANSATSGGVAGEFQDLSDVPEPDRDEKS